MPSWQTKKRQIFNSVWKSSYEFQFLLIFMSNYDHFWKIFRLLLLRSPGLWVIRAAVLFSSLDGSKNGTADYHCKKIILPEWNGLRLIRGFWSTSSRPITSGRNVRNFRNSAIITNRSLHTHKMIIRFWVSHIFISVRQAFDPESHIRMVRLQFGVNLIKSLEKAFRRENNNGTARNIEFVGL